MNLARHRRRVVGCADMGFTTTTILSTAANAVGKAIQAKAEHDQAKALEKAADVQQQFSERQADAMTGTALENHRRGQRNAETEVARARGDAARSNLAAEGSALTRETDLATRLEDDITNRTNAALQEVNTLRQQSALENWDMKNQARQSRVRSLGSALSATATIFNGVRDIRRGPQK